MQNLLAQDGDEYVFGAQASPDDRDPAEFDCAELVEWAIEFSAGQEDFRVVFPESSMTVRDHCDPSRSAKGSKRREHCCSETATSPASDTWRSRWATTDARSKRWAARTACASGEVHGRTWTSAGLAPEVDYGASREAQPRVERAVVFGKKGGRLGFVAAEKLDTDEAGERLLTLLRRADSDTGAGILVIRKEPKDLELQDEWPQFKASKAR